MTIFRTLPPPSMAASVRPDEVRRGEGGRQAQGHVKDGQRPVVVQTGLVASSRANRQGGGSGGPRQQGWGRRRSSNWRWRGGEPFC